MLHYFSVKERPTDLCYRLMWQLSLGLVAIELAGLLNGDIGFWLMQFLIDALAAFTFSKEMTASQYKLIYLSSLIGDLIHVNQ